MFSPQARFEPGLLRIMSIAWFNNSYADELDRSATTAGNPSFSCSSVKCLSLDITFDRQIHLFVSFMLCFPWVYYLLRSAYVTYTVRAGIPNIGILNFLKFRFQMVDHSKTEQWRPFCQNHSKTIPKNIQFSNGIRKPNQTIQNPNHSTTEQLSTIRNPNAFGIQAPTV